ncbi:uncharacterized protein ColSpa_07225 [Colletotrichum spaethianum]|uniref:Uncharacterized protein n=1 Tax=Colletotrichum spaethianum TaxID=700344 RepID=A0AA37P832_9PEZI|nr:uncharacterized protein ColSpa_07225 [Colletotrichum spaethianum]GKT47044.1 hypothetical protein ColSpa_07225 [Colletotrichum spaethianum]
MGSREVDKRPLAYGDVDLTAEICGNNMGADDSSFKAAHRMLLRNTMQPWTKLCKSEGVANLLLRFEQAEGHDAIRR